MDKNIFAAIAMALYEDSEMNVHDLNQVRLPSSPSIRNGIQNSSHLLQCHHQSEISKKTSPMGEKRDLRYERI